MITEVAENQIEVAQNKQLAKLGEFEVRFLALVDKYKGLTISGVDDKEGYDKVSSARKEMKSARVEVEKYAKALRDPATRFNKSVSEREKELVKIILPLETEFQLMEHKIDNAIEQLRLDEEKKEIDRINARIARLSKYNYALDVSIISKMDDAQFEAAEAEAKKDWDKEQERARLEKEAEENKKKLIDERVQELYSIGLQFNGTDYTCGEYSIRAAAIPEFDTVDWSSVVKMAKIVVEQIAKSKAIENQEKARQAEEQKRIAEEQAERQRLLDEQAENQRKEQERIANEQAEKEKALKAEQDRLDAEKKAIEDQKNREAEAERIRIEATGKARYNTLLSYDVKFQGTIEELGAMPLHEYERVESESHKAFQDKMAAIRKQEQEEIARRDEEERLRKEALRPDKEKLIALTNALNALTFPEVSSIEALDVIEFAKKELSGLSVSIYQRAQEL
jgi:hypothetical protein